MCIYIYTSMYTKPLFVDFTDSCHSASSLLRLDSCHSASSLLRLGIMALTVMNSFCSRNCQDLFNSSFLFSMETGLPLNLPTTNDDAIFTSPPFYIPEFFPQDLIEGENHRSWIFYHTAPPQVLELMPSYYKWSYDEYESLTLNGRTVLVKHLKFSYRSHGRHKDGTPCFCDNDYKSSLVPGWKFFQYVLGDHSVFCLNYIRRGLPKSLPSRIKLTKRVPKREDDEDDRPKKELRASFLGTEKTQSNSNKDAVNGQRLVDEEGISHCQCIKEKKEDFVGEEVDRQTAAIRAICDVDIEHTLTSLRFLESCFTEEQLDTPVLEFFKENVPNLSITRNEESSEVEFKWNDDNGDSSFIGKADGVDLHCSSLKLLMMSLGGHDLPDNVRASLLVTDNTQLENLVLKVTSDRQILARHDALCTPEVYTPVLEVFKENLPNFSITRNEESGEIEFKWNDKNGDSLFMGKADDVDMNDSILKRLMMSLGGYDLPDNVRASLLVTDNTQLENLVFHGTSDSQMLASHDALRTPE